jgi:hypothetical protein
MASPAPKSVPSHCPLFLPPSILPLTSPPLLPLPMPCRERRGRRLQVAEGPSGFYTMFTGQIESASVSVAGALDRALGPCLALCLAAVGCTRRPH